MNKEMLQEKYAFFWNHVKFVVWQKAEEACVFDVKPLIDVLAKKEEEEMYTFYHEMQELLVLLERESFMDSYEKQQGYFSPDGFLYARCALLVKGIDSFLAVLEERVKETWEDECEELLYVCSTAWEKKYKAVLDEKGEFYDYVYHMDTQKRLWVIVQALKEKKARSIASAVTFVEAGIKDPMLYPFFTQELVKEGILGETKDKKYYLKDKNFL